jgi:hypothetical protein
VTNQQGMRKLKRAVIKEELVALTGDAVKALLLNQLLYWTERAWDFDQFIEEEKARAERNGRRVIMPLTKGWITKTADQLSEELMIGLSKSNIRRHILCLVERGWIEERENPNDRWSRTKQYRVNLIKIRDDLARLGYPLEGFAEDRVTDLPPAGGAGPDRGPGGGPRGSKIEPREFQASSDPGAGNPGNEGSSILEPRGAEIEPHGSETAPARKESLLEESPGEEILFEISTEIRDVVCVCDEPARQKLAEPPLSAGSRGCAGRRRAVPPETTPERTGAASGAAGRQGSPGDGLGSLPGGLPGPGHGPGGDEKNEEDQGDPGRRVPVTETGAARDPDHLVLRAGTTDNACVVCVGNASLPKRACDKGTPDGRVAPSPEPPPVAGGPEAAALALLLASRFSLADADARAVAASLLSRYPLEAVVAKLPVAAAEGRIRNLAAYLSQAIEEDWHPPVEVDRRRSRGKPATEEKPGWRDDKYADLYLS